MFRNLEAELSRKGMTKGELANMLNIKASTLSQKLNGKSIITFDEALQIKNILCVSIPLEILFSTQG